VTVFEGTTTVGNATVGTGGTWSTVVTLSAGFHSLTATQTLDGQTSAASILRRCGPCRSAQLLELAGVEGQPERQTSRRSAWPTFAAADYRATINWGDGSAAEAGTIAATGGGAFAITDHGYQDEGSFTIQVTVTTRIDPSTTATVTPSAAIADAPLTATAPSFAPSLQSFNGTVATFTDATRLSRRRLQPRSLGRQPDFDRQRPSDRCGLHRQREPHVYRHRLLHDHDDDYGPRRVDSAGERAGARLRLPRAGSFLPERRPQMFGR
jgi:hypothetical protein